MPIKYKDSDFNTDLLSVGLTYVCVQRVEGPVNMNIKEATGEFHKKATLMDGSFRAKRSGNAIKSHQRTALLKHLGISPTECEPQEKACMKCLACALHGWVDLKAGSHHSSLGICAWSLGLASRRSFSH
ncbi:MAG: hypothetical protein ACE5OZ_10695 [Candidatus Heimdallarchaeota archaeon]